MSDSTPGTWDLVIHGRPVETLADLYEWLGPTRTPAAKLGSLVYWHRMNRKAIPSALEAEIANALDGH